MRVHLVYPRRTGALIAPWTIGSHLLDALTEAGHCVSWADWDDCRAPQRLDLVIGHPHPEVDRSFELAAANATHRIAICPYTPDNRGWLQRYRDLGLWHHLLAICGPEWESSIPAEWPATRLDMAVDPDVWIELPEVGPANRLLYVGCTVPSKGTRYLAAISDAAPDLELYHVGPGVVGGRVKELGVALNGLWRIIAPQFGGVISCGCYDANPTAILESAALGLTPYATKGAGWGTDLVVRLPDDDPAAAAEVIRTAPRGSRAELVGERYGWGRFVSTVMEVVNGVAAGSR